MPPSKLELRQYCGLKVLFQSCASSLPLPFFKLLNNFSSHLAIVEIDVANCAVDKLVFKVIVTQI